VLDQVLDQHCLFIATRFWSMEAVYYATSYNVVTDNVFV